MKLFSKINKYTPIVIGLLIIWLSVLSFSVLFNNANKNQLELVPKSTNFVFRLNFKDFLKSTTYSMIFKSKDQALLNTFRDFLNKQRKGTGKSNDFGINYFSDVVIYGEKYKKGQIYVMLVNLINDEKFTKNLPHFLAPNQSLLIKNNIGLIVTYYGKEKVERNDLTSYLNHLKINQNYDEIHRNKEDEFFNVQLGDYDINESFKIEDGYFYTSLTDKELNLRGAITLKHDFVRPIKWTLKEEYALRPFRIESSFISTAIQDTLQVYFAKIGLEIPKVNGVVFNYYGLEIQENDLGLVFAPKFDLILNFSDQITKESVFHDRERLKKFGFDFNGHYLKAGSLHYAIELLDDRTLFIGVNRDLITKKRDYQLLRISGDLAKITEISGGGFIKSIINVIPPFKASKDFFSTIKEYRLSISPKNDQLLFVRGKIKLKDNYYLYNEFLKFYLTLKGNY